MNESDRAEPDASHDEEEGPLSLIAPGGKVDPDLVRTAAGDDDGAVVVHFKLNRDLQKRLDQYLTDRIPFMSRTQLQRLIKEQAVTVNGRVPKASTTLRIADEIAVVVPPPPSKEILAEDIPLDVLYEDKHIIIINKQADIIVHPARAHKTGTLVNAFAYHFQHRTDGALSSVGKDQARPGIVHRLDRNTTGVMCAAKSDTAHFRLGKQFELRQTDKRYLAIVHGRPEPVGDVVNLPIGKHPVIRELMAVRYDDGAKNAVTLYRVREQFENFALVELELKTGRTHQIRVHLSHLGWPIVGDDVYDGALINEDDVVPGGAQSVELMHRQALHATTLTITHPITDERMTFTAPLPADMLQLIRLLREHRSRTGPISPPGSSVDIDELIPRPDRPES